MPAARYAIRPGDPAYGVTCPECGSPKHRQSARCAACYRDARRRGEYPPPPVPARVDRPPAPRGGSRGRPQPQTHPWRGRNALLFNARRST